MMKNNFLLLLAAAALILLLGFLFFQNQKVDDTVGRFCGGIANIQCPNGYSCNLPAIYPDAGGTCTRNSFW